MGMAVFYGGVFLAGLVMGATLNPVVGAIVAVIGAGSCVLEVKWLQHTQRAAEQAARKRYPPYGY